MEVTVSDDTLSPTTRREKELLHDYYLSLYAQLNVGIMRYTAKRIYHIDASCWAGDICNSSTDIVFCRRSKADMNDERSDHEKTAKQLHYGIV